MMSSPSSSHDTDQFGSPDPSLFYASGLPRAIVWVIIIAAGVILFLHENYLSLGAMFWAACGKDHRFSPHSLLEFAKRFMKFHVSDLEKANLAQPISLVRLKEAWLEAVEGAEQFFARLPLAEVGCLYLTPDFTPITPDPDSPDFPSLIRHYGSIRGAWPVVA